MASRGETKINTSALASIASLCTMYHWSDIDSSSAPFFNHNSMTSRKSSDPIVYLPFCKPKNICTTTEVKDSEGGRFGDWTGTVVIATTTKMSTSTNGVITSLSQLRCGVLREISRDLMWYTIAWDIVAWKGELYTPRKFSESSDEIVHRDNIHLLLLFAPTTRRDWYF